MRIPYVVHKWKYNQYSADYEPISTPSTPFICGTPVHDIKNIFEVMKLISSSASSYTPNHQRMFQPPLSWPVQQNL